MVIRRSRFAVVLAVALLGLSGCGSGHRADASPGATTVVPPPGPTLSAGTPGAGSATASPAADYAAWCGDPAAVAAGRPVERSIQMRTSDGVMLAGVEAGSGSRGVLLLPEIGSSGLCGWLDFAAYLAAHGFRTLAIDHRCLQESGCGARSSNELVIDIDAAVARLHRDGAATVALLGASQGATEALIAGAAPPADIARYVTRVVCLSADLLTQSLAAAPSPPTGPAAARRITRPVMYVVSDGDPLVSVADTRALYDSSPARVKRLVVLPSGGGHGWLIVADLSAPVTAEVVAFLRGV